MKKKGNKLILVAAALFIVFGVMIYLYLKPAGNSATNIDSNIQEVTVGTGNIEKLVTGLRRSIV